MTACVDVIAASRIPTTCDFTAIIDIAAFFQFEG